ncbi:MAG: MFS transporter [Paracoccus sp. (in: a-proteobacteria)]|nr:MFS transporter [Paracoccus sp. (in: a-proteobacteria)]
MRRAWHNVIVLVAAQALLGAQMPIIFTVGGLVGKMLAPDPCLATLPLSMVVLGSAISARPLSGFMQRHGRRAGFQLAAIFGAGGAALAAAGLYYGSFGLVLAGSLMTGIYMAAQGFFRFAATDTAPADFQPRAISFVMAGGLASAFVALGLMQLTDGRLGIPFLAGYLVIILLNLIGIALFLALDIPRAAPRAAGAPPPPQGRPMREIMRDPTIVVAMVCAMVSYALMNLIMTSTPLAMAGCGFEVSQSSQVVTAHVLAMFLPSFFTGHLINRFGAPAIVGLGLMILTAGGAVALSGVELEQFFGALILLGVGWNFGFIGATAMLTQAHRPEERARVQGINDLVVFSGVFLASLSSGFLLNCSGAGTAEAGWGAVNLAMLPFLVLAGAALIWLRLRPKETA